MLLLYPSKEEAKRIKARETSSRWRKKYPHDVKASKKKYYIEHTEQEKTRMKKYQNEHPEKIKEIHNNWIKSHSEEYKNRNKLYVSKYFKTPKGKILKAKIQSKRYRELGYNPVNDIFEGSHGHHINKEDVIFIPKDIHKKHPHAQNKPETMIAINRIAFQWLTDTMRKI